MNTTAKLAEKAKQALACMRGLQQHLGQSVCEVESQELAAALAAHEQAQAERVGLTDAEAERLYNNVPPSAQQDDALKLAERMARAAGKTQPAVMVMACSMLLEVSYMAIDPDAWIDWKIARELAAKESTDAPR